MAIPPPGPVGVLVPQWTLITLAAAILVARLYHRLRIQKLRPQINDILLCGAWITATAFSAGDIEFARAGVLNKEVLIDLTGFKGSPDDTIRLSKLYWFSYFPCMTSFYLCKASLLALYFQLFPSFMIKSRILLWVTVIYLVAAYTVTILLFLCICLPIQRNWSLNPEEMCAPSGPALLFQVTWILHFFGDLLIFCIPWLIIPSLQMSRRMRISVYCTFLLGIIDITFSILRFATIQSAAINSLPAFSLVQLWSTLDVTVGIVVTCLPSLGVYFRRESRSNDSKTYGNSTKDRPNEEGFRAIEEDYAENTAPDEESPNAESRHTSPHSPTEKSGLVTSHSAG